MSESNITIRKFSKLLFEVYFYRYLLYLLFVLTGYSSIHLTDVVKLFFPTISITDNFTGYFLVFYLSIPFLNILVKNMNEKQHLMLLGLLGFTYIFMGTVPKFSVNMHYVSWFISLFFIASYLKKYPKDIFENARLWGFVTTILMILCMVSVLCCVWSGTRFDKQMAYYFVTDSNMFLVACLGISRFLLFKNLKVRQSKLN